MYLSNEKKGYHKQNLIDRKGRIFLKDPLYPIQNVCPQGKMVGSVKKSQQMLHFNNPITSLPIIFSKAFSFSITQLSLKIKKRRRKCNLLKHKKIHFRVKAC